MSKNIIYHCSSDDLIDVFCNRVVGIHLRIKKTSRSISFCWGLLHMPHIILYSNIIISPLINLTTLYPTYKFALRVWKCVIQIFNIRYNFWRIQSHLMMHFISQFIPKQNISMHCDWISGLDLNTFGSSWILFIDQYLHNNKQKKIFPSHQK